MCTGALIGLAGMKFSVSIIISGLEAVAISVTVRINEGAKVSFHENIGWKGAISFLLFNPVGFDDPVLWRVIKWIIAIAAKINGTIKWRGKNRFSVGLDTE